MIGVIVNATVVFIGATVGIFLKKFISKKYINSVLLIVNLSILLIGIQGAITLKNPIQMLASLVLGTIVGVGLNIDGNISKFTNFLKSKINSSNPNFAKGFITVALIQCIGAFAIIGPLNAALKGDMTILYIKSALDFASSIIFASMYGAGVFLSGFCVLIYQGTIYLLAGLLEPLLTADVINEVSAIGSLLIIALAFDLLDIKKFKIANYLPAIFMPMIFYGIKVLFGM